MICLKYITIHKLEISGQRTGLQASSQQPRFQSEQRSNDQASPKEDSVIDVPDNESVIKW